MNTIADIGTKRLERVLVNDKKQNPSKLCQVIKSDVFEILKNYMDVESLELEFDVGEEGVEFNIIVKAERIKQFGSIG